MKRKRQFLAIIVSLCFFAGSIWPVYADELSDKQQQLNQVSREINQQRSNLQNKKKQEQSIMGELKSLESDIFTVEAQINSLNERIKYLEDSISSLKKDIEENERELQEKSDILGKRLVYMYEEGDVSYLEVLLDATDVKDFLTRYDMLSMIVDSDVKLIESIEEQRAELDLQKSELEVKQKELVSIREEQETKKNSLNEKKELKEDYLSSVRSEAKAYEQALAELEQASNQLEAMIRQIQSGGSTVVGSGIYTWPTPGYSNITSSYGMRYHPVLKTRKMHTGVDIGAPMGANIVAADSGTVIFAGWMNGYGNVIVLDHGNGMSTLYAHQSSFAVSNGATVVKGQTIGKVGSTGWSTGPHLHFEVRINGAYTDPLPYIQ